MNCPFCNEPLVCIKIVGRNSGGVIADSFNSSYCKNENCMIDDMTRFILYRDLEKTETIISCSFILNDFHVVLDYKENSTTISKLSGCFLMDPIRLDKLIDVDMTDLVSVSDKVKTWLLFS
jgi:hypothetical protein